MPLFDMNLHKYCRKVYSQNDEDGIIEYIFTELPPLNRFFVEFGVGPATGCTYEQSGLECNARLLIENGWHGLLMDGNSYPPEAGVKREMITALNINRLLHKYRVPHEIDLMSIDIDGQDFWIWSNLTYNPRVIIVEYNPHLWPNESKVVPFDIEYQWDGTQWYGASLRALHRLGLSKGYTLVYANGVNAFFIRDDLIGNAEDFQFESVYGLRGRLSYHRDDPLNRGWVTID